MTTWASEMTEYRDSSNNVIPSVRKYVMDAVTDADGQYSVDLAPLGLDTIVGVEAFILSQSITAATDVTTILTARTVEITNTLIKGVLIKGNSVTVSVGLVLKTLTRGGAGINVRLVVAAY